MHQRVRVVRDGDHYERAKHARVVLLESGDGLQDVACGVWVQSRCGFVQQQNRRLAAERPRDADALRLAAAQRGALCAQHSVVAVRELRGDELRAAGGRCGPLDVAARHLPRGADGDVLVDRPAEEHRLLEDHRDSVAQSPGHALGAPGPFAAARCVDGEALAEADAARRRLQPGHEQGQQRRLAATTPAHDRREVPRLHREGDALNGRLCRARVLVADTVDHQAILHLGAGVGCLRGLALWQHTLHLLGAPALLQVRFQRTRFGGACDDRGHGALLQELVHALCRAGAGHRDTVEAAEAHTRGSDGGEQRDEAGELRH
mmetsp:Transcript_94776/g.305970  ORF Transcript_94776/g.305970 Transcript_94776/m.305970 type:complete len:319 (-) Transcript_94776:1415-2371(-)